MQSVRWYFERGAAFFYIPRRIIPTANTVLLKRRKGEPRGAESRKEEEEVEEEVEDETGNARAKEAPMK